MIRYYIALLLLCICVEANAQEQPDYKRLADKFFYSYDYKNAADMYSRLSQKNRIDKDVFYKLAYSHNQMQIYTQALENYKKYYSLDSASHAAVLLPIANIYKILQQYNDARSAYLQYLAKFPDKDLQVRSLISGCDSALQWNALHNRYKVYNEEGLNTTASDWGATVYKQQLVFTSDDQKPEVLKDRKEKQKNEYGWTGNPFLKLYTSDISRYIIGDTLYRPKVVNDFGAFANSSRYHVGPASFNPVTNEVFYTVTNKNDKLQQVRVNKKRMVKQRNLQLMYSVKDTSGAWADPKSFVYNKPDEYSVGMATFSVDGKTLYFASDMPGGYGKTDIWYTQKDANGNWKTPENCGQQINTAEEESFPVINAAGDLFFSSKGHAGMGGYDIFQASGFSKNWKVVQNVKPPLNSSYDDFSMFMTKNKEGYFSSNRPGGKGMDDIYSFKMDLPETIVLKTTLIDKQINKPIPQGTIVVKTKLSASQHRTNNNGVAYTIADRNTQYVLLGEYKDYAGDSIVFTTPTTEQWDIDTVEQYVYMSPKIIERTYKTGERFVLEDLYYDYKKYDIRPDAALVLDKLADVLKKYPAMAIELSSHTDSRGSDAYNMRLSQQRAESAVNYIISKGIDASCIKAKGYGEKRLLNKCKNNVPCTEEEHQKNRRTEVRILKM